MKNILLIDDDAAAHTYHTLMIETANINFNMVKSVYSVDDAMVYLKSINQKEQVKVWPNFIFVDLNMPQKTGFDFIEEFDAMKWENNLPRIYFVSSTKNPVDIEKASNIEILSGFETKFLQKEFFENTL